MEPSIISFYTLGTPYEEEAKKLLQSCSAWELSVDIAGIDSKGSWEKNCGQKPFFILKKLKELNRPLLWVDADAIFKQRINFSEFENCDVSVRLNEFLPQTHASRIVSNTIFVRNSPEGIDLIEDWCRETEKGLDDQARTLEFWDQTALRDALKRNTRARFLPMPLKYAKIFDFDDLFISEEEVVIEHFQASRRFKHQINCCS